MGNEIVVANSRDPSFPLEFDLGARRIMFLEGERMSLAIGICSLWRAA
ncbi:hypothetical protein WMF01_51500 [Sorangium sp. So ce1667]